MKEEGNNFVIAGQYSKAIKIYFDALKLAELKKDTFSIAVIYNNIGTAYKEIEDYKNALLFLKKGEKLIITSLSKSLIADIYNTIGNVYYATYEDSLALLYYNKSLSFRLLTTDSVKLAKSYNNLAAFYLDIGKFDKGNEMMQQAINIRLSINDSSGIASSYLALGESYLLNEKFDVAKNYLTNGYLYVIESSPIYTKRLYLEDFALIYAGINDYKNAFKYQSLLQTFKDSILNIEKSKQIAEMQTKYETEKKESENKILHQENSLKEAQLNRRNTIILVLGISILLIFIVVLWRINVINLKKKEQELVATQKIQKEKERLSRDLHDNIGSLVSFISTKVDWITKNRTIDNDLQEDLNLVKSNSKNLISGLRETLWTLNSQQITNFELVDKLKPYIKSNLIVPYQINDELEQETILDSELVLNVYRCCQEIINNINKHSQAKQVSVIFSNQNNTKLTIILSDDGIGISEEDEKKENHYGLKNIKSRLKEVGALFNILSEHNKGTKITIIVN